MITVEEAEKIILAQHRDFGTVTVLFEQALGSVLAEDLKADRDLPPFNRVTVDGIAIKFEAITKGLTDFQIKGTQAAGEEPLSIDSKEQCIEIMTGSALSSSLDTVIRYEDIEINNGIARLLIDNIQQEQNIHFRGSDKKRHDVIVPAGQIISPPITGIAASVGKTMLLVKNLPRVVIISSGDELVDVGEYPSAFQIRKSNSYTVKALLMQRGLIADTIHIPDDPDITAQNLSESLQKYDVILLSGGVSMGKFDYIPKALETSGVKKLFHQVQQRPGKPFWFGSNDSGVLVFAFPGNPVATFMCLQRYFLLWLDSILNISRPKQFAMLESDFNFKPQLKYFLQVKLAMNEQAQLIATPVAGNGSGDFANLADTDAFLELPSERNEFKKGEVYEVLPFN